LNDFTTLIYYNIGYNLFSLRQSSRRSWRINQHAPRIEVYFLYYANTMQSRAMRLMASKLAVAGVIEGNFSDEGLVAMSECQDMTTLLAQELTMGIQNEVEDLSAVFKRMAVLRPEGVEISGEVPIENSVEPISPSIPIIIEETRSISSIYTLNIPALPKKRRKIIVDEAQLSLFDLPANRTA